VNQTLMRSINTSVIALLPVAGLLFVGAGLLGAGTLKDLALVIFVGMLAGAYSSIFLATPLVCDLVEREPRYADLRRRVAARRASDEAKSKGRMESAEESDEESGAPRPTARRRSRAKVAAGARSGDSDDDSD